MTGAAGTGAGEGACALGARSLFLLLLLLLWLVAEEDADACEAARCATDTCPKDGKSSGRMGGGDGARAGPANAVELELAAGARAAKAV